MPFRIALRSDWTLARLLEHSRSGEVVVRTPHVGNVYGNNLGLAALGLRLLFYDRTLGTRDNHYHPHLLVAHGRAHAIADPSLLTSHARTLTDSAGGIRVPQGVRVADVHMDAMHNAYPGQTFETWSDFLARNAEQAIRLLRIATAHLPGLWRRRVDAEGRTHLDSASSWEEIERRAIFSVTAPDQGWLTPNELNVLLMCVIDGALRGRNGAILLAGPEMASYISSYAAVLESVYDALRVRPAVRGLPETFDCIVVPVHRARFQIDRDLDTLDTLVRLYLRIRREASTIRSECAIGPPLDIRGAVRERDAAVADLHAFLREHRVPLERHVFYDIERPDYFSQHDLSSAAIRVHRWSVESPLHEVDAAYGFLRRHFDFVRRQAAPAEPLASSTKRLHSTTAI